LLSEPTGPRLTEALEDAVLDVLDRARYSRLAIQSDWARMNGTAVAAAASLGFITTETRTGFGRVWRPTASGLAFSDEGVL
jgi:hypothetical protein